jgi:hypothetical protein
VVFVLGLCGVSSCGCRCSKTKVHHKRPTGSSHPSRIRIFPTQ